MNLADQLNLENTIGRLRAMECAIQALILAHPDPAGFGETFDQLMSSVAARTGDLGEEPHVLTREAFRDSCGAFRRAAEVAMSTRA